MYEFSLEALGYGVVVDFCLDMLIQAAVGSLGGWDLPLKHFGFTGKAKAGMTSTLKSPLSTLQIKIGKKYFKQELSR